MASFLDKAGLTKFWELIKEYLNDNYTPISTLVVQVKSSMLEKINDIYDDILIIDIDNPNETVEYDGTINRYSNSNIFSRPGTLIVTRFYNRILLLKNVVGSRSNEIKLGYIINNIFEKYSSRDRRYLGRLPYNEIYDLYKNKPFKNSSLSFDIYLIRKYISDEKGLYWVYRLKLIPVQISNSYTLNFIPREQMIRYLGGKIMGSGNFCKINLVTDSPFDFTRSISPISENNTIDKDRLIHLYNKHDIEYTIRYPRYLNGMLTFLKIDSNNNITLADKTPDVIDGTYNEVILTQNTGLYMYGDINIVNEDFPITEEIKLDISSTQDTTGKLLSLGGDISTIYGLLRDQSLFSTKSFDYMRKYPDSFHLFHSPYIGDINIGYFSKGDLPLDPIMDLPLYVNLFNNTGISTAISGIHFVKRKLNTSGEVDKQVYNNYKEAYKDCKQLTKLLIYIYLEGDINLDSTLDETYINYFYISLIDMISGSSKLNNIVLLPGVQGGLTSDDFEKFSRLIKPIADKIKSEQSSWNVEIKNTML